MTDSVDYTIEPYAKHFDWKEMWRYSELFYFFTWRDLKIKYKQASLGFLWDVLRPLLMMTIFTFFLVKPSTSLLKICHIRFTYFQDCSSGTWFLQGSPMPLTAKNMILFFAMHVPPADADLQNTSRKP